MIVLIITWLKHISPDDIESDFQFLVFYFAFFFATYKNYNNQYANIFIIIFANIIFIYALILIMQPRNTYIYSHSKHESTEVIRKKRNTQRKVTRELVRSCGGIRTTETAFLCKSCT